MVVLKTAHAYKKILVNFPSLSLRILGELFSRGASMERRQSSLKIYLVFMIISSVEQVIFMV